MAELFAAYALKQSVDPIQPDLALVRMLTKGFLVISVLNFLTKLLSFGADYFFTKSTYEPVATRSRDQNTSLRLCDINNVGGLLEREYHRQACELQAQGFQPDLYGLVDSGSAQVEEYNTIVS
jgi:hypothetical protein